MVQTFRRRRVRHSYSGFDLTVELVDPLGAGWYDHDWPVMPEIELLRQHALQTGATVFDIGAHQCVVASVLARIVGGSGLVVAVEGNSHNASAGRTNIMLNGLPKVTVIHGVVAAAPGDQIFNKGLNGGVAHDRQWGRQVVRGYSVDQLSRIFGFPDVMFTDVEGYECQVLAGALETIAHRPDCFVEVHVGAGLEKFGGSVDQVCSYFTNRGYELYVAPADGGEFCRLDNKVTFLDQRFYLIALANGGGLR